jgi:hypothetical protein
MRTPRKSSDATQACSCQEGAASAALAAIRAGCGRVMGTNHILHIKKRKSWRSGRFLKKTAQKILRPWIKTMDPGAPEARINRSLLLSGAPSFFFRKKRLNDRLHWFRLDLTIRPKPMTI